MHWGLFKLPTLLNSETVLLVEGEKDVLNLNRLGFVATCNPMGAGKWRPEDSDQLAGKHVVIFPDNDEPGRTHAESVAQSLQGKAASVKVVPVPRGKDVSDWIWDGATRADIDEAIQAAPVFTAGSQSISVGWPDLLLKSERGVPKPILANAITALRSAPEWAGVLAFDEFSRTAVSSKLPPWPNAISGRVWTDDEDRLTTDWLQHQGILVSIEITAQAVQTVAKENPFHPVRDYLDGLRWDGTPRLDGWLSLSLGVDPTPYSAAVGAKWMISAVARIYEPGVKVDSALILEGNDAAKVENTSGRH